MRTNAVGMFSCEERCYISNVLVILQQHRVDLKLGHFPEKRCSKQRWCVLCGGSGTSRGHRTRFTCSICKEPLCVVVHSGLRKTCFELWHTRDVVERRSTPTSSNSSSRSQSPIPAHTPSETPGGRRSSRRALARLSTS